MSQWRQVDRSIAAVPVRSWISPPRASVMSSCMLPNDAKGRPRHARCRTRPTCAHGVRARSRPLRAPAMDLNPPTSARRRKRAKRRRGPRARRAGIASRCTSVAPAWPTRCALQLPPFPPFASAFAVGRRRWFDRKLGRRMDPGEHTRVLRRGLLPRVLGERAGLMRGAGLQCDVREVSHCACGSAPRSRGAL